MSFGRSRAALLVSALLVLFAFSLAAGCGGDDEGQEGQQQETTVQVQGGATGDATEAVPTFRIAVGTVESADPEANTLTLQPTAGEEARVFVVAPQVRITLDNQVVSLAEVREGQNAQIRYVVREGENRARDVTLFSP